MGKVVFLPPANFESDEITPHKHGLAGKRGRESGIEIDESVLSNLCR